MSSDALIEITFRRESTSMVAKVQSIVRPLRAEVKSCIKLVISDDATDDISLSVFPDGTTYVGDEAIRWITQYAAAGSYGSPYPFDPTRSGEQLKHTNPGPPQQHLAERWNVITGDDRFRKDIGVPATTDTFGGTQSFGWQYQEKHYLPSCEIYTLHPSIQQYQQRFSVPLDSKTRPGYTIN